MKRISEGKVKILFEYDERRIVQRFKDNATAFNGELNRVIPSKSILNNSISSYLMKLLFDSGVKTHFIEKMNESDQLTWRLDMIPIEFVVRNIAAGSITKKYGIPEGTIFGSPIIELFFKKDELGDPMMNLDHCVLMGLILRSEYSYIEDILLKVNRILINRFASCGLTLVDFKVEFGKNENSQILLGDEITPDTCRIWDSKSGKKLDKDVFRFDLGDLLESYKEIALRLGAVE